MTPRAFFLQTLLSQARLVRGAGYEARRGVIDWATHTFEAKKRAIAVIADDYTFGKSSGINEMTLTLEFATSMSSGVDDIDDAVIDEMAEDAESVLFTASQTLDAGGNPAAISLLTQQGRIIEFSDVTRRVQGIVLTLPVTY